MKVEFSQADILNMETKVRDTFNKVLSSKQMLDEIGTTLTTDVREQTRAGKSIPLGAELRLLKEKWIVYKKHLSLATATDENYEEGKSNLTFTGQLLKAFTHKILGKGLILLYFKGDHQPYVSPTGLKSGKPIPNEKLAEYVAKGGRPFVGVRPTMKLRINRIVKTYVKRALVVARLTKE